jgi:diguanylate cyclase (GGDEF)-like protein
LLVDVKKACGLDLESLDKMPIDVVLARPHFDGEQLADAEIVWANKKVHSRNLFDPIGLKFSEVYPQLVGSEFLNNLHAEHGQAPTEARPFKRTVFGPRRIPYELTTFWAGELIYAHVNEIDPELTIEEGLPFALQLIFGSISTLPMAASYRTKKALSRHATAKFLEGFSVPAEVFATIDFNALVHSDDLEAFNAWQQNPVNSSLTIRVCYGDQNPRWVEVSASDVLDLHGNAHGQLFTFIDIDEQMKSRETLERSEELKTRELSMLTSALDVSRDGFAIWSKRTASAEPTFTLEFINAAGAGPTGKHPDELIGKTLETVLPNDHEGLKQLFSLALSTYAQQVAVVEVDSEAGWVGAYENRVLPLSDNQVVTNFRDISEERSETRRLEWLSNHDHLTGLINRRGLEDEIDTRLQKLNRDNKPFGFAFIDLDGFKQLNDEFGHDEGDRVLVDLAKILVDKSAAMGGIAARISGDEFGLLFDDVTGEACCNSFVEDLRPAVSEHFSQYFGRSLEFSAGTVLVKSKSATRPEILRVADRTMYQAKNAGKHTSRHFTL